MSATMRFEHFDLADVHRFSDPTCRLYRAFGLTRARLAQMLGFDVWWRGFLSAIWEGHGFGVQEGDGFRMPGAFLLHRGQVLAQHRPTTPADRLDFISFVASTQFVTNPGDVPPQPKLANPVGMI